MTSLASGSKIAVTFYLPFEQLDEADKPLMQMSIKGAADAGTPFISFFTTEEVKNMANHLGFNEIQIISTKDMTEKYFKNRTDNLAPASGEFFLVARL